MLTELLIQLGKFGICIAVMGWLSRTIVIHFLNKDIAQYKAGLGHAHNVEMEKLRTDSKLRTIEHEIRFRSVHERQAMVLARTYQRLSELHSAVANYARFLTLGGEPSLEEKLKIVEEKQLAFRTFYFPRRIFLPRETAQRVTESFNQLMQLANTFTRLQRPAPENAQLDLDRRFEEIQRLIEPGMDALEAEFRRLLGMTAENPEPGAIQKDTRHGS